MDLTDRVTMDPRLTEFEVSVSAMTLTWDGEYGEAHARDYKDTYKFSAVLHRPAQRWPQLTYTFQTYDAQGLLLDAHELRVVKTLDKEIRQLTSSGFHYAPLGTRFEVVVAAPGDEHKPSEQDGWQPLPVRHDADDLAALGLTLDAADAEVRPNFDDYAPSNLLTIHFTVQFGRTEEQDFPEPMLASVSVYDENDRVLSSGEYRIDRGPRSRRNLSDHIQTYNHRTPAYVRIDPYAG